MAHDPLTHFDDRGAARMVSIEDKDPTRRHAEARARVRMQPATCARIAAGEVGKGDVLGVARLAGIQGAKLTPQLIPLCHPVGLTSVEVDLAVDPDLPGVQIRALVRAVDRTGPEMEALTAAATAGLAVIDMCKAMDRTMALEAVELWAKSGGKSGAWRRDGEERPTPR